MSTKIKATFENIKVGDTLEQETENSWSGPYIVHSINKERKTWSYLISESYYDKKFAGKPCINFELKDFYICNP